MKVLHVLCELKPSGAETMLQCAGPYMQAEGIQSDILATGNVPGVFAEKLESAGYKIHHIPFRKHPQYFIDVYRLLKNQKYDALHVHPEQGAFWLILLVLLAGVPAKRCIKTIHNNFQFTGNLRIRRAIQRKILTLLGVPHIAISKSVQNVEWRHFKNPTEIILNWYDSQRFIQTSPAKYQESRDLLNLTDRNFVIVSVGNCSAVKNHTTVIQSIANLGNKDIVYLHIGIEADHSEQDLAANLGIAEQIRFLGLQSNILPYLQAADLYIMPSTVEGLSIAAIEAIATEVPVLLSKVPGLIDFDANFNGIDFCEPTTESVQEKLQKITLTPKNQLREATAKNAEIAEQLYGIKRGVLEYLSYYQGNTN